MLFLFYLLTDMVWLSPLMLQTEGQNPASKGMDLPQDSGPTTPLPDKKLLVFILDRLQKKDTYGVFAEPVDPEELPDYHDIIKHPMDFATIRKKLSGGAYANLEQFEKDVILICSNAMQYNAPDTIYYRQARSIQELAKKNFENLRQESDDNEPEPKPVRRGRPPSKNIQKKVGRPPVDRAGSNFSSNATHSNAGDSSHWTSLSHDLSRKGLDKTSSSELPAKPYGLRIIESHSLTGDHKSERNEDNSGSAVKGFSMKYPKKSLVIDENRRITYSHPQVFGSISEPSVLTTFEGERKQLIPVGLYMEHAYARSLARFAANLGPIGWEIAAKRIESVLPPGTKFGRGWVGDNEVPQQVLDSGEVIARNHESAFKPQSAVGGQGNWQKIPFHLNQAAPAMQPTLNGFNNPLGFNHPSQVGKSVITCASPESFSSEAMRTHSRARDMVARNSSQTTISNFNMDKVTMVADPSTSSSSGSHLPDSGHDSQGTQGIVDKSEVGFYSQNPNLSLQL
uniref:Bromo domain-containing protein n=1 Tax=Musa acuminata subsp. malaccensis TaxID=214687 RepID=A0A804IL62_MUSAM